MNMKLPEVVTPPSIYHGCYTWKTFWEEKFTGEEKFTLGEFKAMNIKMYGRRNVRKHRDIKDSDKYTTLVYVEFWQSGKYENHIFRAKI